VTWLVCSGTISVDNLRDALADRIKTDGRSFDCGSRKCYRSAAFVRGVLAMRDEYDRIVSVSFRNEGLGNACEF
jgi:hypothetical protein